MNDRLMTLLVQRGMSTNEAARRVGVSDTTIRRLLGGDSTPTRATCRKLADFFGVSIEWLFGIKDEARHCLVCGAEISDRSRLFCSKACGMRHAHLRKKQCAADPKTPTAYPTPPSLPLPMPCVGERRMEKMTVGGAFPGERLGEQKPQPCTVVQVVPMRGWYRVVFDRSGLSECYKVPNLDPLSSKIK